MAFLRLRSLGRDSAPASSNVDGLVSPSAIRKEEMLLPAPDDSGKLVITSSDALDELLRGRSKRSAAIRKSVQNLRLKCLSSITPKWPALPELSALVIQCDGAAKSFTGLRGSFPALKSLTLQRTGVNAGAKHHVLPVLEGPFPVLESIQIIGVPLSSEGLTRMLLLPLQRRACPHLKCIKLGGNEISPEVCAALAKALQSGVCPLLTDLNLEVNVMGAMGCAVLAKALLSRKCLQLSVLDLCSNGIGDSGCAELAKALQQGACPQLTRLNLWRNKIGSEGCKALAEAMQAGACSALTHLYLGSDSASGNFIRSKGCEKLIKALRGCPALQLLDLSYNGIRTLPDDLRHLTSLKALYIDDNKLTRIQPALYDLILQLKYLNGDGNPLEDPPIEVVEQGTEALQNYLREAKEEVQELRIARIMLLGSSMHGKTTLCRSLLSGCSCADVRAEQRTHALEIYDWTPYVPRLHGPEERQRPLTIKLWDFAGQDIYTTTHLSFFSRLCIYALVVKIEEDPAEMDKVIVSSIDWLMTICKAVPSSARILLVGTFFRSQEQQDDSVLHSHLQKLKDRLVEADEARVKAWNEMLEQKRGDTSFSNLTPGRSGIATKADIIGGYWVDCHARADHNLRAVGDKLMELAEEMVTNNQRFPRTYRATLETHQALYKAGKQGVMGFWSLWKKISAIPGVEDASDEMIKQALRFANDVGILQYYPKVDDSIIFINPLFLVQTLGVLIYDEVTYTNYLIDGSCKDYVFHGSDSRTLKSTLYDYGIIRKGDLGKLWTFADEDSITESVGKISTLWDTLIEIMIDLDLAIEHQGLVDTVSTSETPGYYLVPELWTRRLRDGHGEKCTEAERVPGTYDPQHHVSIGCRFTVQGWLLNRFFQRVLCECAKALKIASSSWREGTITLGTDALRWTSASWPEGPESFVLCLYRQGIDQITVKVAGLEHEREALREVYLQVIRILEETMEIERIATRRKQFGITPRLDNGKEVEMVWLEESEVEKCRASGKTKFEHSMNNSCSSISLFYFDEAIRDDVFLPNFESTRLIPRKKSDPEFLVRHCGPDDSSSEGKGSCDDGNLGSHNPHQAQLKAIVDAIMKACLGSDGQECPEAAVANDSAKQEAIENHVHIEKVKLQDDECDSRAGITVYVCHPLRNWYIPIQSYYKTILADFCEESMRLFYALRMQKAKVAVSSSKMRELGEVSAQRSWTSPPRPRANAFDFSHVHWFFLKEPHDTVQPAAYGLDLTKARDAVLAIKTKRLQGVTELKPVKVDCECDAPEEVAYLAKVAQAAGLGPKDQLESEPSLKIEYEFSLFRWSRESSKWK